MRHLFSLTNIRSVWVRPSAHGAFVGLLVLCGVLLLSPGCGSVPDGGGGGSSSGTREPEPSTADNATNPRPDDGQSIPAPVIGDEDDAPEAAVGARQTCREVGGFEQWIDDLFAAARSRRDAGHSSVQAMSEGSVACTDSCVGNELCTDLCITCTLAVISEVYGFSDTEPGDQSGSDSDYTCDVSYYDSEFGYGFELPGFARLDRYDDDATSLVNAYWVTSVGAPTMFFTTRVTEAPELTTLLEFVDISNRYFEDADGTIEFLVEREITQANGDPAFLSIFNWPPYVFYDVLAMAHGLLYKVGVFIPLESFTTLADGIAADTVVTLCVD